MRQAGLSVADAQFRTALSNARLCICTDDDMALFNSRVCGLNAGLPHLLDPDFEHVSIITALNAHRDAINSMQAIRFARARGLPIIQFYSRDKYKRSEDAGGSLNIPAEIQEKLWRIPACSLPNPVPGILTLCVGMPIMIKYNEATELCVTNGAEATVAGWVADTTSSQRLVLRVLFVTLTNPATPVQLPGLPPNVVPLIARTYSLSATIADKGTIRFSRSQIPILVNFAMTDYSSQGRTRPKNIVDPRDCRTTQSIYTCLSRGSSLAGLLLLNKLDPKKLKGGLNGNLRDELDELEILADITELRYEGQLKEGVQGSSRRELLRSFRAVYGQSYKAKHGHELRVASSRKRAAITPPSHPDPPSKKRRLVATDDFEHPRDVFGTPPGSVRPVGMRWDGLNSSGAYDSLLTIVANCTRSFPSMWDSLRGNNRFFDYFISCLDRAMISQVPSSLTPHERARDELRDVLHTYRPQTYPRYGDTFTDIGVVAQAITFSQQIIGSRTVHCIACDDFLPQTKRLDASVHIGPLPPSNAGMVTSVAAMMQDLLYPTALSPCPFCHSVSVVTDTQYHSVPSILGMELTGNESVGLEHVVTLAMANQQYVWHLVGVVYSANKNFSCRFLDEDGTVWFHDGAEIGSLCIKDADDIESVNDMSTARGSRARLVLYRLLQ